MAPAFNALFSKLGVAGCAPTYLPFARQLRTAESQADGAVLLLTRDARRDLHFDWLGPALEMRSWLWGLAENPRLRQLSSETKVEREVRGDYFRLRFAVRRQARDHMDLLAIGFPVAQLELVTSDTDAFAMLLRGRVDVISASFGELRYYAEQMKVAPARFKAIGYLRESEQLYLAVSKKTTPELRARLQSAVEVLQQEGVWPVRE